MILFRYYTYSIALAIATAVQGIRCTAQEHMLAAQDSTAGVEIVIISSHKCPPCKRLKNDITQLITLSSITPIILYTDDANDSRQIDGFEQRYSIKIRGTPTTVILRNKQYLGSFAGYSTAQDWWNRVRAILIQT